MTNPRKKIKLNRLFFESQASQFPQLQLNQNDHLYNQSDSYSNTNSPIHEKVSYFSREDFQNNNHFIQQNDDTNVLKSEQFILDESNDVEMRINEWLDRNNIKMVSPEDIIHDFYHKIRMQTLQKMEIELNEIQYREESSQNSSNDLDYEGLDYSHNKKNNKQKAYQVSNDVEKKLLDVKVVRSKVQDRQAKKINQNLTLTSKLLQRRINLNLVTKSSNIDCNNYVY
ncbi:hypothetical protein TTHERM_00221190 (macronuclear) [Tetrahymena thermophila SB210]|uniref:Uncharacterized protein n=1 Tax=Tetrahymena thermophila (strain SB210) TaxID=312017 RepID=I7M914_TETTS|nr:hypothetical protein TTHERM_00221190 [Tetrahymena thermophila SB210]EAS00446.1 hypothetical protein TTHERM_00221190 [Tetrahymena thermophila SB210]|eukprot:XP_001020691.1 hypothetical protein TTHERM_00221190 [Tetrahymena thermophila SB210]